MINGVVLTPLQRLSDDRGSVWHMLKSTDPVFTQFGEIYFSTIYPGVIKGWHLHTKMDLNYACIVGAVKIVLFDSRSNSSTYGQCEEYWLGKNNYQLLHIPHGITNAAEGLGSTMSIIANCATLPHDPQEIVRLDPATADIPYDWQKNK